MKQKGVTKGYAWRIFDKDKEKLPVCFCTCRHFTNYGKFPCLPHGSKDGDKACRALDLRRERIYFQPVFDQ